MVDTSDKLVKEQEELTIQIPSIDFFDSEPLADEDC